ncbi:MAG: sigma-70 family RNA polymerase sigma factor [Deltaproteobacteria bacterium]|nr:sigma-70 family RNA polymerase sigma factor [Deltaproteobacteria bacterium]
MILADPNPLHSEAFKAHERFLWGLSYRMTGCAADADDVLQETFIRALEHVPGGDSASWRPWLVRVAMNLSRDVLRRRKRGSYIGPWLPSPIETGEEEALPAYEPLVDGQLTTEGRYDLLESVSFAFLLALEALTPRQRAVLLLMEVFDYTVLETASALEMSPANVKVTHHRARKTMAAYDRERRPPTRALQERTREVLGRFVAALNGHDVGAVEALLAESVRSLSDGGGEFFAARVPIDGPKRVARFYWNVTQRRSSDSILQVQMLNGLPAVVVTFRQGHRGEPPYTAMQCLMDDAGRITRIYAVLATRKLSAVSLPSA